jgi:hypothetical protein
MPAQYRINWKAIQANYAAISALDIEPKCVKLSERSIAMILSQLGYLYWQKRWEYDGDWTDEAIANIRDWTANVEHQLLDSDNCEQTIPDETQCYDYTPSAPFISYAPQDPFQQPDTIPSGYILPPFYHNAAIPLPGVIATDAMVNLLAVPLFAHIDQILNSGFPRITINLTGEGKVTIEMVKVPQGGIALVNVDNLLSESTIYPLEFADLLDSAVFEDIFNVVVDGVTDNTFLIEIDLTGTGNHQIFITFLPVVSESELLGFGGGIRKIELCGFDNVGVPDMPSFELVDCVLKWRPNDAAAWTDLGNVCGADGSDGSDGLTPLITEDDSVPGHHKIYLAMSDNPTDTVLLADILDGAKGDKGDKGDTGDTGATGADGADGECPDCGDSVDKCNVAFGVVHLWQLDHIQAMFAQMIADSATLDSTLASYDASMAAYGLTVTDADDFRNVLKDIAFNFTVDAPYHTFAEYIEAFEDNLDTYEVSLQCLMLTALTGAFVTETSIDNFLTYLNDFGSGDSYLWGKLSLLGGFTELSSWGLLVNDARAVGGDYTCEDCGVDTDCLGENNTYTVPANGSGVSSYTLRSGVNYRIVVSGVFYYNTGNSQQGDALYFSGAGADWTTPSTEGAHGLAANGSRLTIQSYQSSHVYNFDVTGSGSALVFTILDNAYDDNAGSLSVRVYCLGT